MEELHHLSLSLKCLLVPPFELQLHFVKWWVGLGVAFSGFSVSSVQLQMFQGPLCHMASSL